MGIHVNVCERPSLIKQTVARYTKGLYSRINM